MRDMLFTRVETNEYQSGLRNRGCSESCSYFFRGARLVLSYIILFRNLRVKHLMSLYIIHTDIEQLGVY